MRKLLIHLILLVFTYQKCSFQVMPDNTPVKVDRQPFIVEGMTQCLEYNGKLGCCDIGNQLQQTKSFVELDGIFSSLGGGCDICAINLKRFWCQYACSPNQSQFSIVHDGYEPVPNPQKPDETLMVQKIQIKVHAQTACQLFNACSRNQFVSSVSAMTTPAGFLTFQGRNAVNDALQYIDVKFSYNKSNSIYFGDDRPEQVGKPLHNCNTTTNQSSIHGFPFLKNCTCSNCASSCKSDQGFVYKQSSVLQDFNYILVFSTWAVSILISIYVQSRKNQKKLPIKKNSFESKSF